MTPEARRGVSQTSWICSPHSKCAVLMFKQALPTSLQQDGTTSNEKFHNDAGALTNLSDDSANFFL